MKKVNVEKRVFLLIVLFSVLISVSIGAAEFFTGGDAGGSKETIQHDLQANKQNAINL